MIAAILTFVISFTISIFVLLNGHLHEDAYILYIYAENLAKGLGITYFEGGPPAEGATDFLWMVLLSGFNLIGINSGLGAAILNSVGLSVSAYFLSKALFNTNKVHSRKNIILLNSIISLLLIISPIASASYAGFSTAFYTCFIVIILYILSLNKSLIPLIPALGLVLALIRPDGVILGVCFTFVGAYFYKDNFSELKKYFLNIIVCFFIGCFYFLWRYNYFGFLLPLPLYVKSSNNLLFPGFIDNLKWVYYNFFTIIIVTTILYMANRKRLNYFLMLIPSLILFIALAFATQSQNVSFRFQAPLLISIFFLLALESKKLLSIKHNIISLQTKFKYILILIFIFVLFKQTQTYYKETKFVLKYILNSEYVNYFPYLLKENITNKHTIALTEAGRFAYWLRGKKVDLVGLNTAETAIKKSSVNYLKKVNPDIIFIHVANSLINQTCLTPNYCEVTVQYLKKHLNTKIYKDFNTWKSISNGVYRSPLVVYDYLLQLDNEYDLFLVKYENNFNHLYALKKKSSINKTQFLQKLEMSFNKAHKLSYLEMIYDEK